MPNTLPGKWYQVLGVRYPGATTEEIKRAYKQLSVKLHPDKNAHHKEKVEGLFKTNREGKGWTARHRGPKMARRHTKRGQAPTPGGTPLQ